TAVITELLAGTVSVRTLVSSSQSPAAGQISARTSNGRPGVRSGRLMLAHASPIAPIGELATGNEVVEVSVPPLTANLIPAAVGDAIAAPSIDTRNRPPF